MGSLTSSAITSSYSQFSEQPRRQTPTVPPGFAPPASIDELNRARSSSVNITPAVPVIPVCPSRTDIPGKKEESPGKDGAEMSRREQLIESTTIKKRPRTLSAASQSAIFTILPIISASTQEGPAAVDLTRRKADVGTAKSTVILPDGEQATSSKTKTFAVGLDLLNNEPRDESAQTTGQAKTQSSVTSMTRDAMQSISTSSIRPIPAKLNIAAAARKVVEERSPLGSSSCSKDANDPETVSKSGPPTSTTPIETSRPSTPVATGSDSPHRLSKPRSNVLRVMQIPRIDNSSVAGVTSAAGVPTPLIGRLASRQGSVTSLQAPGTPSEILISDTNSTTSVSYSRANSPPLATRTPAPAAQSKSKSKKKREAQEKSKQSMDETTTATEKLHVEEQAPIGTRKKKSRKTAQTIRHVISSGRPASVESVENLKQDKDTLKDEEMDVEEGKVTEREKNLDIGKYPKQKDKDKEPSKQRSVFTAKEAKKGPATPSERKGVPASPSPKSPVTVATLLKDLESAGALLTNVLDLFKQPQGISHRAEFAVEDLIHENVLSHTESANDHKFTSTELEKLKRNEPVRYGTADGRQLGRHLITPMGTHLRGLSEEMEDLYLQVETRLAADSSVNRYTPKKIPGHDYSFGGKGSYNPSHRKRKPQSSPLPDDALNYVNQFMAPSNGREEPPRVQTDARFDNELARGIGLEEKTGQEVTMSVEEAERLVQAVRRETEALEKRLSQLVRKNRKLLTQGL